MPAPLEVIGLGALIYIFIRLLHRFSLYLEDQNKLPWLQKLLAVVIFLLGIMSFYVTLVLYGVEHLHQTRLNKLHDKEMSALKLKIFDETGKIV